MLDYKPRLTYYPNRRRAQITVIALGVCALISVMIIVNSLMTIEFFQRLARGNYTMAEATALDERARALALFEAGAYLVTAIIFLFWIHRAYKNHEQLSRHSTAYSPNWAVGGFFVPFLNWVRPYQVVREMWDESQAGAQDELLLAAPSHAIIITWWLTFLAMNLISRMFSMVADTAETAAELTSAINIDIVVQVLTIVSAVCAMRIIQKIDVYHGTQRQQAQPTDLPTERSGWTPLVYAWSLGLSVIVLGVVLSDSSAIVNQLDRTIAAERGAVPARQEAGQSTGKKLTATPASQASKKKSTATPAKRSTSVLAPSQHEERGQEYLAAEKYEQALEEFSQALKDKPYNEARLYYLRGLTYSQLEEYDTALIDLNRAIKLNPKYMEAYYERGMAHFHLGNYGLASEDFDQALKFDADYPDAYIGRGYTYYAQEDYSRALADLSKAVRLDDSSSEAYFGRGLVYYATSEYLKAAQDFSKTLELDDEWADAYYRRGMTHYELENLTAAQEDFNRAIELAPEYIDPYFDRGILLMDLGEYAEALADLNKVVDAYPQEGIVYLWRGAVYTKLNETEKAIADLERAVKWSVDANVRREAEELLKELKGEKRPTS
jgi:tetratricopeptide (TPR) repeat protein